MVLEKSNGHLPPGGLLAPFHWIAVLAAVCVLGFFAAITWWVCRCSYAHRGSLKATSMEDMFEDTPLRLQVSTDRNRMPALVRLLGCVALNNGSGSSRESLSADSSTPPVARQGNGRYEYSALEDDGNQQERLEMESKAQRSASRDKASFKCQQYLYNSNRYAYVEQLSDIGSRVEKHWFVVKDTSLKTERLLSVLQVRGTDGPVACTQANRETLQELFVTLQHPYIYPVLDVDFAELCGRMHVVTVLPLNTKGSLKDFIYKTTWKDDWSMKYAQRSTGMPITQVQRVGRQILEALIFLKNRGFPTYEHLHSGNIILQNGAARLTGLENTLLGLSSRVHPVIWSRARSDPSTVDSLCFGHVLFEMCAGYELCTPQPTPGHLQDVHEHPQALQVLEYIFNNPSGQIPSIAEISACEFFRNIDLREMRAMPLPQTFQPKLTEPIAELLTAVRLHQNGKSFRSSRPQSSSSPYESVVSGGSPNHSRRSSISSSSSSCANSASSAASSDAAALHQTSSFTHPAGGTGSGGRCGGGCGDDVGLLCTPLSASASSLYATPHASMSLLLLSACSLDAASLLSPDAPDDQRVPQPPQLDNSVHSKEHRGLSLHLSHQQHLPTLLAANAKVTTAGPSTSSASSSSCLTRRLASH